MSEFTQAIVLHSELNPWIDMCIVPHADKDKVKQVSTEAFDSWFDVDTDEPIGDYIKRKLTEAGCSFDIYWCMDEEES